MKIEYKKETNESPINIYNINDFVGLANIPV
jgi:hypothetical protein